MWMTENKVGAMIAESVLVSYMAGGNQAGKRGMTSHSEG
jgi:hypothetical protein